MLESILPTSTYSPMLRSPSSDKHLFMQVKGGSPPAVDPTIPDVAKRQYQSVVGGVLAQQEQYLYSLYNSIN